MVKDCRTCDWNIGDHAEGEEPCSECEQYDYYRENPVAVAKFELCEDDKRAKNKMSFYGNSQGGQTTKEAPAVGESDPNGIAQHDPGAKNDYGKTRWSLLPWKVIEGVAKVMTFGAAKYSDGGWKAVPAAKERYYDALLRHKMRIDAGEYLDPDSGLPHWAHFACNAVFLGYFYLKDAPKSP